MAVNREWLEAFEAWLPELQEAIPSALESVTRSRVGVVGVALYTDADASIMAWTWMTEGMITDYHAHVDTMIEWVELLNPPARSAPYVAWLRENGL